MNATIKGFKCYDHVEVSFSMGEITLLKGASGIGKSTIFQAITWCLYNTVRGVEPRAETKGQELSVLIRLHNPVKGITHIYRRKKPCLLKVMTTSGEYVDKSAQSIINTIFAEPSMWEIAAYIKQKGENALTSRSASERMEVISRLAFGGEEPDDYINRIEAEISTKFSEHKTLQDEISRDTMSINGYLSMYRIDISGYLPPDKHALLLMEMNQTRGEIDKLIYLQQEQKKLAGIIYTLEEQVRTASHKIANINIPVIDINALSKELEERKRQKDIYLVASGYIREEIELRRKVEIVEKSVLPILLNAKTTALDLSGEERLYSYMKGIADANRVPYDEEKIGIMIKELEEIVAIQPKRRAVTVGKRILALPQPSPIPIASEWTVSTYLDFVPTPNPINVSDIHLLESEVNSLRNTIIESRKILRCPHCSGGLKYMGGILQTCTVPDLDLSGELSKKEMELTDIQSRYKIAEEKRSMEIRTENERRRIERMTIQQKRQTENKMIEEARLTQSMLAEQRRRLEKEFAAYGLGDDVKAVVDSIQDSRELSQWEISSHVSKIAALRTIKILPNPLIVHGYTSEDVKRYQEWIKLKEHHKIVLERITADISTYDVNKESSRINSIQATIQEYTLLMRQKADYMQSLEVSEKKLRDAKVSEDLSVDRRLYENQCRYGDTERKLHMSSGAKYVLDCQRILEEKKMRATALYTTLADLDNMKKIARDIECFTLQRVVDSINHVVGDIISHLFDHPITVSINLFKETKTTGKIKPNVNISIIYRGSEYDSVSQLSGGEADRISLALTLAFNQIACLPCIFLDEVFSSLPNEKREAALEAIRMHAPGKMVVIIAHEGVEGIFDKTIEIEKVSKKYTHL